MIVAPLLTLVLDAILGHRHTVVTQPTDGGFGLSAANADGLHARNVLKGLHQTAGEVLLQILVADLHAGLGRLHLVGMRIVARYGHIVEHDGTIRAGARRQETRQKECCHYVMSLRCVKPKGTTASVVYNNKEYEKRALPSEDNNPIGTNYLYINNSMEVPGGLLDRPYTRVRRRYGGLDRRS